MFLDFTEEKMPTRRYIFKLARHKVVGGWYARVVFSDLGHGATGSDEAALFIPDHQHSWQLDEFRWEMLQKEPVGGIYRAKGPHGWLLLSTASGIAKTDDGVKYRPRMGSLVFVPDVGHTWECNVIEEKDPIIGA